MSTVWAFQVSRLETTWVDPRVRVVSRPKKSHSQLFFWEGNFTEVIFQYGFSEGLWLKHNWISLVVEARVQVICRNQILCFRFCFQELSSTRVFPFLVSCPNSVLLNGWFSIQSSAGLEGLAASLWKFQGIWLERNQNINNNWFFQKRCLFVETPCPVSWSCYS